MRTGRLARGWAGAGLAAAWAVLACGLLPAVAPAVAEAVRRYSGRVTAVDLAEGIVVVEELGRRGVPVRHEVRIDDATPLVSARRLRARDMQGSNAYGEVEVTLADLLVGDFVVVESVELDGQTLARRITIVETPRRP
jgi:hypothetical protein